MDKFWDLLKESVILQAVLTIGIWGILGYLVITERTIPDIMIGAANLVLGYYFGAKMFIAQSNAYKKGLDEGKIR